MSNYAYNCYFHKFMLCQFDMFSVPKEEILIPPKFFEKRSNVHIKIPFSPKNESVDKKLLDIVESYTKHSNKISYSWLTLKVRILFLIKDKLTHHHHVIYKGECSCNELGGTGNFRSEKTEKLLQKILVRKSFKIRKHN